MRLLSRRPYVLSELVHKLLYHCIDVFDFFLYHFLKLKDLFHHNFCLIHFLLGNLVAQVVYQGMSFVSYVKYLFDS